MNRYMLRVYFEDTDCGQIVYHTNYLKYCERARSELFFAHKMQPCIANQGFVLKHIDAEFVASARLGDTLEVRTQAECLKNASIILLQDIYRIYDSTAQKECDELVFKSRVTLAFVDVVAAKPRKIPHIMLEILQSLES